MFLWLISMSKHVTLPLKQKIYNGVVPLNEMNVYEILSSLDDFEHL
jgi:hypothetical protein